MNARHLDPSSVVVLYKGGRLSSWHSLSAEDQEAYQQEHVDLMLAIAHEHRMQRLEGFRLMTPQDAFERFWIIEFPAMDGAEAWIGAEMAPPYGRYGYYEYDLARHVRSRESSDWVATPAPPVIRRSTDPRDVPVLNIDANSVVVLQFEQGSVGSPNDALDYPNTESMKSIAHELNMMRYECFQLIAPKDAWHRVRLAELPTTSAAEAWIEALCSRLRVHESESSFLLTRRWAPEYFASWIG